MVMAKGRAAAIGVAVLVAVAVAAMAMGVEGAVNCGTVTQDLAGCLAFATGKARTPSAACCNGVRSLKAAARTTPDRRAACQCIKSTVARYGVSIGTASRIPPLCRVSIGFPISASVNCNTIR